ncbi:secreted lipase [Penicillium nucicola]|uniref:secreted lipase n=1 Tax=Penicillium nucicola TaxID=1850975 RepID=UPI002545B734|nr:secreted lipase [Penicillium nucicola]KAJ5766243.1 secreted lipase [Penicillium nucicola]
MVRLINCLFALSAAASLAESRSIYGSKQNPIVDLGSAGRYLGTLQNNGTVQSWKGIPYAQPPLDKLRFEPPRPLAPQSSIVINTTAAPDRCVQFTLAPYGVHNAYLGPGSPGTEDCLKLFVWKPAKARQSAKLPVMGGGLVFGDGLQDDYGDWVGHDQKFIAVNMNYRLGILGFMNHPDLPSANAGILDQRMAMRWVKQNIAAFGGDPDNITIMGQSGGGWAIAAHLGLYDGRTNGTFQKAIARSIQREPMFNTEELTMRNEVLSQKLNCTGEQLACFRSVSVSDLVDVFQTMSIVKGTKGIFANKVFGYQGSFGPTIDGVTLTDSVTRLFKDGKTANVPTIAGCTSDEGYDGWVDAYQMNPTPSNTTRLDPQTNRITNLTDSQVYEIASFYPVSAEYGAVASDNFFLDIFKSYWMALGLFGEVGIFGSERMMGRWLSAAHGSKHIWSFRFNAPPVGASFNGSYPLAPATHSTENSYLNDPLSTMTDYEHAVAIEFRAYLSSFIRTGNPNTEKLASSPHWPHYGALGDFVNSPVRLVPQFAFKSNANKSYPTSTQIEVSPKAGIERTDFWQSDKILESIRF